MSITITLLIQGLAFFAVAWLVMQFGWPSIMSAIETRQKKIAEGLAAADRGQKDLDDARANAHEIVKEARNKATQIVDQANRRSNEMVEDAKGVAIAEGERLISVARADVSSEAGRARAALTQEVASQYEMLRADAENTLDAEVTVAMALTDAQRQQLASALGARFKRTVRLNEQVDATLLGGAIVRAGDVVIDGSLRGRLNLLAQQISQP